MKKIVFTFGRYNPPTTGHAELITYTVRLAQRTGAEHRIYTSQSQDPSKNPLSARQKMAFLRQIFPGVNFVEDPAARSAFIIAKKLADQGYEDVTFVVGADRVDEFKTSMSKYVKPRTAKDFNPKIHYPFKKFQVVSSGARKRGISGTDLRAAVRRGDFATFAKASAAKDKTLARKIYAATKSQLNEEEIITEAPWRPVTGSQSYSLNGVNKTEFQHEFDSKGGEIASQYKSSKEAGMPKPIERAMGKLSKSPGLVRQMMTGNNAKREIYSKEKIRKRGVLNTTGGQSWSDAKKEITPERIKRAEMSRTKTQTSPTILRVKDPTDPRRRRNIEWNIGGNTRLSSAPDRGARVPVHVLNMKENTIVEDMSRKEFDNHLKSFINFTCDKLGIQEKPSLRYKEPSDQGDQPSFAAYSPSSKEVIVMTKNRHPMDVFRSVAHELVHHKQNEDGRIGKDVAKEGATGSDIENEANARAGELMRWYGKANPQCFSMSYVTEDKAIILSGTPGSGKDRILKEAILPHGFTEVSSDRFDIRTIEGNVVVNGAAGYERIRYIKEQLEGAGYQTIMVFVNTSNEVSKQRNEARIITGGRVINEAVRYTKWKNAQDNLAKYDQLFEKVIEVKNDLNLNENQEIIQETYGKLMKSVSKEIAEFALKEADRRFENMIRETYSDFSPQPKNNPVGGAGNWGTSKLTDRYKADTPGEQPGVTRQMGYYEPPKDRKTQVKVFGNLPKFGDRIGATYTSAKNPSFVGDITSDQNVFMPSEPMQNWSPIDRWMMKEETRKRFKEKYGKLAEQKMKETVARVKNESLVDPFMGSMGATPNSMVQDVVKPDINAEFEKMSIFKKVKARNKLNTKK